MAVTDWAEFMVTRHALVPVHPPPVQPANVEFKLGAAVSCTPLPVGKSAVHLAPQSMAAGVDVTRPLPPPADTIVSGKVALQTPTPQALLEQSVFRTHLSPAAQAAHPPPPQSTSLSLPFFTWSSHLEDWQMSEVQTPVAQSPAAAQAWLAAHFLHSAPPQSTSVSVPLLRPSLQPVAWHTLAEQKSFLQSALPPHAFWLSHLGQVAPPQSTSVSSPSRSPSVQSSA